MDVCDAFCGVGGFSAGAIEAGCRVIMGIDSAPVPLKVWAANTGGTAVRATIGVDEIKWPDARADLHVHLSPACQVLSKARAKAASDDAKGVALDMLRRCVALVQRKGYTSWSIETVSTPATVAAFRILSQEHIDVAFATLDAADYGCPSSRLRLIASTPALIRRLEEMPVKRVSTTDAFAAADLPLPADFLRSNTKKRDRSACVRSVQEQAFTVTASHPLTWCDRSGVTRRCLNVKESACLMGFRSDWMLPTGQRTGQRAVGNSVPVQLSTAIMRAAFAVSASVVAAGQ